LSRTLRRPPRARLFPYTTLFRPRLDETRESRARAPRARLSAVGGAGVRRGGGPLPRRTRATCGGCPPSTSRPSARRGARGRRDRSEEHTSELQSRENLVCRRLLE